MKIAIPTSDRINVFLRTGRAKEFAICEIIDGSYEFVEFRENPHQHIDDSQHQEEHNHKEILELLKDCNALLAKAAGTHFRADFIEANIPIYKTDEEDLKEAMTCFTLNMVGHKRIV